MADVKRYKIELFPSIFAIPIYDSTGISHFIGADAEVARILQSKLDITGI